MTDQARAADPATLHAATLVLDSHIDVDPDFNQEGHDPGVTGQSQLDLPQMRAGGVDCAVLVVFLAQRACDAVGYAQARAETFRRFAGLSLLEGRHGRDRVRLCRTPDDVAQARHAGVPAVVAAVENGYPIGDDPAFVEVLARLGTCYVTLTHIGHNQLADSSMPVRGPESPHGGLSALGRTVVARLNAAGILVDVSHTSVAATLQACALSQAPVIASHSSCRALAAHPRNATDEELRAIAGTGGVIQIVAVDKYLQDWSPERSKAWEGLHAAFGTTPWRGAFGVRPEARERFAAAVAEHRATWPAATLALFCDHIDHAVRTVGIDHVGIASDFNGGGSVVGWATTAEAVNVTAELVRRGYDAESVGKLWGGNFLRAWRAAQATAT